MLSLSKYGLGAFGSHMKVMAFYSVIANLLIIAPSIHMLQVYDRVLASRSTATLLYLTLFVGLAMVVYGIAEAIRSRVAIRIAAKYTVAVAPKVFARLGENSETAAQSGKYLRDFSSARAFLGGRSFIALFDLPFIPVYTAIMFILHWSMGVLTIIGILTLCLISWLNIRASEADREKSRTSDNDAIGFAQSVFQRVEDMRAGGLLPTFLSIWGHKTANGLQEGESAGIKSAFYQALSKSFRQMLQVIMMAWGAFLVLQNEMSAGMIFMSTMMSSKALGPIDQIIGGWEQISKGAASVRDIESLTGPDKSVSTRMTLPVSKGVLAARSIDYAPDKDTKDQLLLNAIDLELQPGEAVLITGRTGAGKSTLLRILAGAISPTSGTITIDDVEQSRWPTAQWGGLVGYVPQDIEFFPGTLAQNITRFDRNGSQEALIEAAKQAGAHEMIMRLPNGYRTMVGQGAFMLSSGQKQKIALARAMYGKPKILILDEPNANLDQAGEAALLAGIVAARNAGTSVIIAAHRNSVMRAVDRVLVLRDGRLMPLNAQQSASARNTTTTSEDGLQSPLAATVKVTTGQSIVGQLSSNQILQSTMSETGDESTGKVAS